MRRNHGDADDEIPDNLLACEVFRNTSKNYNIRVLILADDARWLVYRISSNQRKPLPNLSLSNNSQRIPASIEKYPDSLHPSISPIRSESYLVASRFDKALVNPIALRSASSFSAADIGFS